jgi:hypothetical protein
MITSRMDKDNAPAKRLKQLSRARHRHRRIRQRHDWARERVATAEKLVFKQRCAKCHIMVEAGAALPAVRPRNADTVASSWRVRSHGPPADRMYGVPGDLCGMPKP